MSNVHEPADIAQVEMELNRPYPAIERALEKRAARLGDRRVVDEEMAAFAALTGG